MYKYEASEMIAAAIVQSNKTTQVFHNHIARCTNVRQAFPELTRKPQ